MTKKNVNKKGKVKSLRPPVEKPFTVVHSEKAWIQTQALIAHYGGQGNEVSWFTPVEVNKESRTLYIPEIFVPEQEVHGTEVDAADLDAIVPDVISAGYGLDKIRGWFHLHPRSMSTNPSSQDEGQVQEYLNSGFSTLLRGILNNAGDINLDYYDDENNIHHYDLDNVVLSNEQTAKIQKEILEVATKRVSKKVFKPIARSANAYHGNNNYSIETGETSLIRTHYGQYTFSSIGATNYRIKPIDVANHIHPCSVEVYTYSFKDKKNQITDKSLEELCMSGVITEDDLVDSLTPYFGKKYAEHFYDLIIDDHFGQGALTELAEDIDEHAEIYYDNVLDS